MYEGSGFSFSGGLRVGYAKQAYKITVPNAKFSIGNAEVSYTGSEIRQPFSFLDRQAWDAFRITYNGIEVGVLKNESDRLLVTAGHKNLVVAYYEAPLPNEQTLLSSVVDLYGGCLLFKWKQSEGVLSCTMEGVWGRWHRAEVHTEISLELGPLTLKHQFRSSDYLLRRGLDVSLSAGLCSVSWKVEQVLGHKPVFSGETQAMQTIITRVVRVGQLGIRCNLAASQRKLTLFLAGRQYNLSLAIAEGQVDLQFGEMDTGLAWQSERLSASFTFRHSFGSVTMEIRSDGVVAMSFDFVLTSGRYSGSPPEA